MIDFLLRNEWEANFLLDHIRENARFHCSRFYHESPDMALHIVKYIIYLIHMGDSFNENVLIDMLLEYHQMLWSLSQWFS